MQLCIFFNLLTALWPISTTHVHMAKKQCTHETCGHISLASMCGGTAQLIIFAHLKSHLIFIYWWQHLINNWNIYMFEWHHTVFCLLTTTIKWWRRGRKIEKAPDIVLTIMPHTKANIFCLFEWHHTIFCLFTTTIKWRRRGGKQRKPLILCWQ